VLFGVELAACRRDIEPPAFADCSGQITVLEDRLKASTATRELVRSGESGSGL